MSTQKVKILVTGPAEGGWAMWQSARFQIWLAGGKAIRMRPPDFEPVLLPEFDGLVLGGGEDIDPKFYDETLLERKEPSARRIPIIVKLGDLGMTSMRKILRIIPHSGNRDPARDEMEFAILAIALKNKKPVLGVCRGIQVINVHFGGSLYQDISFFYKDGKKISTPFPRKSINVLPDSRLGKNLASTQLRVNGLHSQAIERLGEGLRAVAWEEVGIIQGIESSEYPNLLGVQWHPEFLPYLQSQRSLFTWLISKVRQEGTAAASPGTTQVTVESSLSH